MVRLKAELRRVERRLQLLMSLGIGLLALSASILRIVPWASNAEIPN